jgi:hypothetical protein
MSSAIADCFRPMAASRRWPRRPRATERTERSQAWRNPDCARTPRPPRHRWNLVCARMRYGAGDVPPVSPQSSVCRGITAQGRTRCITGCCHRVTGAGECRAAVHGMRGSHHGSTLASWSRVSMDRTRPLSHIAAAVHRVRNRVPQRGTTGGGTFKVR